MCGGKEDGDGDSKKETNDLLIGAPQEYDA